MNSTIPSSVAANPATRRVSVVVPVYRAGRFVREAVDSALAQEEVAEVLLVEDGSPDDSLEQCRRIAADHPSRVKLHRHADGGNHGAGASRNLGLRQAEGPYVAFLDADDLMCPDRFGAAVEILAGDTSVDGVFEPVTYQELDADAPPLPGRTVVPDALVGLRPPVAPGDVLAALVSGDRGVFHTNGITLRSTVIERVGGFNPALRLSQDTEYWWRIASICTLASGGWERPAAVVRRHRGNRYSAANPDVVDSAFRVALSVWRWARSREDVHESQKRVLVNALERSIAAWPWGPVPRLRLRWVQARRWAAAVPHCPSLLTSRWLWTGLLGGAGRSDTDRG